MLAQGDYRNGWPTKATMSSSPTASVPSSRPTNCPSVALLRLTWP